MIAAPWKDHDAVRDSINGDYVRKLESTGDVPPPGLPNEQTPAATSFHDQMNNHLEHEKVASMEEHLDQSPCEPSDTAQSPTTPASMNGAGTVDVQCVLLGDLAHHIISGFHEAISKQQGADPCFEATDGNEDRDKSPLRVTVATEKSVRETKNNAAYRHEDVIPTSSMDHRVDEAMVQQLDKSGNTFAAARTVVGNHDERRTSEREGSSARQSSSASDHVTAQQQMPLARPEDTRLQCAAKAQGTLETMPPSDFPSKQMEDLPQNTGQERHEYYAGHDHEQPVSKHGVDPRYAPDEAIAASDEGATKQPRVTWKEPFPVPDERTLNPVLVSRATSGTIAPSRSARHLPVGMVEEDICGFGLELLAIRLCGCVWVLILPFMLIWREIAGRLSCL